MLFQIGFLMGTPLPEISPPGDYDNYCWMAGLFVSPSESPNFLTVEISGVSTGSLWIATDPSPPNGRYILTQDNITDWLHEVTNVLVGVAWNIVLTQLFLRVGPPANETVFDEGLEVCKTFVTNSIDSPAGRHYYGGSFRILGIH